ncbi:MAG: exonuclease SbcCD subunit D, partial [Angelakisella sp.]
PDVVLLSGDIYDRGVPATEAVELLDDFLTALVARGLPVLLISGNHDSPQRLNYGGRIFAKNKIYISTQLQDSLTPLTLRDEYGEVHFYLLPFLRPAEVRSLFPQEEVASYEDGVGVVLRQLPLRVEERNVLLAHQFFVAPGSSPLQSDSELVSVGGLDSVSTTLLDAFDYAALGHLHGPQRMGRDGVRYGGSPLKYSFSESLQTKCATLVELREKGDLRVELLPLVPLRDMRELRGSLAVLTSPAVYSAASTDDYIRATLTDEDEIVDAIGKLRAVYPNLLRLDYDNARTRALSHQDRMELGAQKSALELFRDFYAQQNGAPLTEEKEKILVALLESMGGLPR